MKTKLISIAVSLLFAANVSSSLADSPEQYHAQWMGLSAVNVNGTWYYCEQPLTFDNVALTKFHDSYLGEISALHLGGQAQASAEHNWDEGSTITMSYKIDNGQVHDIDLVIYNWDQGEYHKNMVFQSGGSSFTGADVNLSNLAATENGIHTIEVWFHHNTYYYDNNNNNNYVATFKIKEPTPIASSNDISVSNNPVDVQINGLTLYKDGFWNTICLPFSLTRGEFEMSVLNVANVEVRELYNTSSFSDGTLTLNFSQKLQPASNATLIEAGKPYIIKWDNDDGTISNPIFTNVKLSTNKAGSVDGSGVAFKGTFDEIVYNSEPDNILFVGAGDVLNYPASGASIHPFRAYFELDLPSGQNVKAINLNFGDDTNSIQTISNETNSKDGYYTIDGRRLNEKPATAGLYIINGKKVVIK